MYTIQFNFANNLVLLLILNDRKVIIIGQFQVETEKKIYKLFQKTENSKHNNKMRNYVTKPSKYDFIIYFGQFSSTFLMLTNR